MRITQKTLKSFIYVASKLWPMLRYSSTSLHMHVDHGETSAAAWSNFISTDPNFRPHLIPLQILGLRCNSSKAVSFARSFQSVVIFKLIASHKISSRLTAYYYNLRWDDDASPRSSRADKSSETCHGSANCHTEKTRYSLGHL